MECSYLDLVALGILVISICIIIGIIILAIILSGRGKKSIDRKVKCPGCKHEFTYTSDSIVRFKWGTNHSVVECPRCHNYINVDP